MVQASAPSGPGRPLVQPPGPSNGPAGRPGFGAGLRQSGGGRRLPSPAARLRPDPSGRLGNCVRLHYVPVHPMARRKFHDETTIPQSFLPHSPSAGTHVARHCAGGGVVPGRAGVLFLRTPGHVAPGTHRPPIPAPSPIHGPPRHAHQRRPAHHALLSLPHRHRRRLRCARRTDDPPGGRAAPETRGRCADRGQHRHWTRLSWREPSRNPLSAQTPGSLPRQTWEPSARTRPVISPQRIPRLSPSSQTPAWYPCPPAQAAGPKYRPLAAGPRSGSAPRTSPTISPGPDAPWTSPN